MNSNVWTGAVMLFKTGAMSGYEDIYHTQGGKSVIVTKYHLEYKLLESIYI